MDQIKVIVKEPGERWGHVALIENTLEAFQALVEGYIEPVNVGDLVIICNEEGKIRRMKENLFAGGDIICGPVVICGQDGEEFTDCPLSMEEWKEMISIK